MSKIQKQSNDDKESINSIKKIDEYEDINVNLSENNLNENISNDYQTLTENKKIVLDTPVNITVELGKSKIKIKDFLNLKIGSMLILDKLKKEPLDIFMNGRLIAFGEIVVLENKYGLRITSIKKSLNTKNFSA